MSQGYLKLYLDGRLTNADDQRRAFQQTRDALGVLATLCTDMGKVGALSESPSPALPELVTVADFLTMLRGAPEVAGAAWSGDASDVGAVAIATHGPRDLTHAAAIVAKAAFDEARDEPRFLRASAGDGVTLLAGTEAAVGALAPGPDADGACEVDFMKGGKGLRLIWAAFILQQHRVRTWSHQAHRASVGFRFPLVQK